ncbi:MAG: hypothetical protein R2764_02230 [Bacteroidales bacterium]
MQQYAHGSHWECIIEDGYLMFLLETLLNQGDVENKTLAEVKLNDGEHLSPSMVHSITIPEEFSAMALVAANNLTNENLFVTAYPFIRSGEIHRLKIIEIIEWDNNLEAYIKAETMAGQKISFFDTMYFYNKTSYNINQSYNFHLSAIAYTAETLPEKFIKYKGKDAEHFYKKFNKKPEYEKDGKIKPFIIHIDDMVAFIPLDENFPEDYGFQSTADFLAYFDIWGQRFCQFRIQIFPDPEVYINLFAKNSFFSNRKYDGGSIRGNIWMQGYLAT